MPHSDPRREILPPGTVLIVGAGPVGLITATTLAQYGVRSVILERNLDTTRWPKMDLTIARSMEIFKRLGIAEGLRQRGVDSSYPFTCLFSSGLNEDKAIASWDLPSVDGYRQKIHQTNDGSMPAEPWQRVSQEVFEAWLKRLSEDNDMIDLRFGWKVLAAHEDDHGAHITAAQCGTSNEVAIDSQFLVACDGANSIVRNSLGIEMEGGPIPAYALLVHFKSKDVSRIRKQGQFWHIFFPNSAAEGGSVKGAIIAQDEIDTWTVHRFLPAGFDSDQISSEDAVASVLGGIGEPFPVQIDEILVRSTWRPSVAVAKSYISPKAHIFLAGDSVHQTVPTGGYGMNTGIADAYDLGWKLAATINEWGGPQLLQAYEDDRRPVAQLAVNEAKSHMMKLMQMPKVVNLDAQVIDQQSADGEAARKALREYVEANDGHNKSLGIEMGYRYSSSLSISSELDKQVQPPVFNAREYRPTTCPGFRAPHVFLKDGSSIFDKLANQYTLVHFADASEEMASLQHFYAAAKRRTIPFGSVSLVNEDHARAIWGAKFVLVRPDGFVSWHANTVDSEAQAHAVLSQATGWSP